MAQHVKEKIDTAPKISQVMAIATEMPCACGCGRRVLMAVELADGRRLRRNGPRGGPYVNAACAKRHERAQQRAAACSS